MSGNSAIIWALSQSTSRYREKTCASWASGQEKMNHRLTLALLLTIIGIHVVLSALIAAVTPYRTSGILLSQRGADGQPQVAKDIGAPDERQHANYITHLLKTGTFPIFKPGDPDLYESYQSHQPPAYYLIASGWCILTGAQDLEQPANGLKLRALNVLIGSATVAGLFFLGYWGLRNERVGLCAAAVGATLPMNIALSGAVSNDPLLICLCTWTLALCGLAIDQGWNLKRSLTVAALVGLGLLTKTTALALVPAVLVAIWMTYSMRPSLKVALLAAGTVLLIVLPWWARNMSLYHDPLALKAFGDAFKGSAQKSTIIGVIQATSPDSNPEITYWLNWIGWWTGRSLLGAFGYMDIWINETGLPGGSAPNAIYRLFFAGIFVCLLGWVLSLKDKDRPHHRSMQVTNACFLVVIALLFVRFNSQYFQAQARYLLPALGPISIGIAIGLDHLTKKRVWISLPIVLCTLGLISVYVWTRLPDEFAKRSTGLVSRAQVSKHLLGFVTPTSSKAS